VEDAAAIKRRERRTAEWAKRLIEAHDGSAKNSARLRLTTTLRFVRAGFEPRPQREPPTENSDEPKGGLYRSGSSNPRHARRLKTGAYKLKDMASDGRAEFFALPVMGFAIAPRPSAVSLPAIFYLLFGICEVPLPYVLPPVTEISDCQRHPSFEWELLGDV
jgi:hypothetical protein